MTTATSPTAAQLQSAIETNQKRTQELTGRRASIKNSLAHAREDLGAAVAAGDAGQEKRLHAQIRNLNDELDGVENGLRVLRTDAQRLELEHKNASTIEQRAIHSKAVDQWAHDLDEMADLISKIYQSELAPLHAKILDAMNRIYDAEQKLVEAGARVRGYSEVERPQIHTRTNGRAFPMVHALKAFSNGDPYSATWQPYHTAPQPAPVEENQPQWAKAIQQPQKVEAEARLANTRDTSSQSPRFLETPTARSLNGFAKSS